MTITCVTGAAALSTAHSAAQMTQHRESSLWVYKDSFVVPLQLQQASLSQHQACAYVHPDAAAAY